ncbi:MAG: sugar phosphate isomerase/epimerase [Anaerolineae bacterium]|nr:sugar phosphate isomerase/epimerase [Anaerolineae bacterium]
MTISVGNTPLSWGIQSVENAPHAFGDVLNEICETGYAGTELGPWGYLPTDPEVLRAELNARNLTLTSAFVHVRLTDPQAHEPGAAHVLEVGRLLAALGARILVLADDVDPDSKAARYAGRVRTARLSEDEWTVFATGVSHIAEVLHHETGLRLAFQHHAGTHIEIADEVRLLLDRLNPDRVGLCLDTGHWRYAGGDPLEAVQEYGQRIWYVHLADCDPNIRQFALDEQLNFHEAALTGVFCPLGEGDVPFPAILDGLRRLQYEGWVIVEQDAMLEEPDTDRLNARHNRDYLQKLGL